MDYFKFIFYGVIQGLTEFIPVSSTAHLKIVSLLFGIDDPGSSISAIIQMGSVFAIFCYFRKNIFDINNSNKTFNLNWSSKLCTSILIGTIPILCFGGIIKVLVAGFSDSFFRSNLSIALVSLLMSLMMFLANKSKNKFINLKNHDYLNSLCIGIAQAFAIIPGVSRSGSTISMALLTGWDRKDATKFSFILGIPAISIAALVELFSSINQISTFPFFPLVVGLIASFFSSLLAINFLIKFITYNGLTIFIFYRLAFGILIILNL